MVLRGFTVPRFTEFDPPGDGEGGLDPLGLGSLAERLADGLTSPVVTARMRRVRFLTAVAAAAVVCEPERT